MLHSRFPVRCGFVSVTVACLLALLPFQALAEEYRSPVDGIQVMKYENGRLSLEAKDAPLDKVLSELSRIAMLTIVADGPIEGRITLYVDRLPLEKALRKILRGKDTSFVYTSRPEASPAQYEISEVRIYLAKAEKGQARRYTYSPKRNGMKRETVPSSLRGEPRGNRGVPSRPPAAPPRIPGMAMSDETKRFLSEVMKGNLEEMEKIQERFRKGNPEAQEQIKLLLESLDDVRARAGESGASIPPMEGLEGVQEMMKQLLQPGKMSPEQERE